MSYLTPAEPRPAGELAADRFGLAAAGDPDRAPRAADLRAALLAAACVHEGLASTPDEVLDAADRFVGWLSADRP